MQLVLLVRWRSTRKLQTHSKKILKNFYEVVAAPDFDNEALKILKKVNLKY